MKVRSLTTSRIFRPAIGAALAVGCGLALWLVPLGEHWANASYDYLFLFGARPVTNQLALIFMDEAACLALDQSRTNWDRAKHAELLNKLADDGCPLVVFDVFFKTNRQPESDSALAAAMRRHGPVVIMAKLSDPTTPRMEPVQAVPPSKIFLDAATHSGVGKTDTDAGGTARRHWPFPASADNAIQSLPWKAAELAGARLNERPVEQWLRYYGEKGGWEAASYHLALSNAPGYFHDKIVFIGSKPENPDPGLQEDDKFRTPYTRWTREAVGGVEIMATTFLNLMNGDWLRRPASWVEMLVFILAGSLLGGGLTLTRPLAACATAAGAAVALTFVAVFLSYATNFWFPWLMVVGGQLPCALAWGLVSVRRSAASRHPSQAGSTVPIGVPVRATIRVDVAALPIAAQQPFTPDYERPHLLGKGAFGEVWLARSAIGQWQALKIVYRANFDDPRPYDVEFEGIEKYKPVSEKHTGLLRVEFVSRKRPEGYYYYVMELGDSEVAGWESNPTTYRPRTLASLHRQAASARLPAIECARIGLVLGEALEFLHQHGLTHRDIKPANIVFVNGRPKLADVGLVTHVRPPDQEATRAGTPGYMPPPPEPQGTTQADIYALGMVLYVVSTGRDPARFPELSRTLLEQSGQADFMRLNPVIMKACHPQRALRYASTSELLQALRTVLVALETEFTREQNTSKP